MEGQPPGDGQVALDARVHPGEVRFDGGDELPAAGGPAFGRDVEPGAERPGQRLGVEPPAFGGGQPFGEHRAHERIEGFSPVAEVLDDPQTVSDRVAGRSRG
ncbi:hypothetical protein [Planomonospora algeriensis]